MDAYNNSNGEIESLEAKLLEVLDRLEQDSKLLKELQSRQKSLTEQVRGLERATQRLLRSRDDSASSASAAQGKVVNRLENCNIYFSSVGHPVSDVLKG